MSTQLDRIEQMLKQLLNQQQSPQVHAPNYTPTIDDEMHAVVAQGGSIAEWLKQRAKRSKVGHRKGDKR